MQAQSLASNSNEATASETNILSPKPRNKQPIMTYPSHCNPSNSISSMQYPTPSPKPLLLTTRYPRSASATPCAANLRTKPNQLHEPSLQATKLTQNTLVFGACGPNFVLPSTVPNDWARLWQPGIRGASASASVCWQLHISPSHNPPPNLAHGCDACGLTLHRPNVWLVRLVFVFDWFTHKVMSVLGRPFAFV